jgi:LysM repeat protein
MQGDYTALSWIETPATARKTHMNKKQLKRLTALLSDNQYVRELDKLKLSRNAKTVLFKARKKGGVR